MFDIFNYIAYTSVSILMKTVNPYTVILYVCIYISTLTHAHTQYNSISILFSLMYNIQKMYYYYYCLF